ncbi:MAG: hypothetical protein AB8H86_22360 [Polyangiales bacterium]
MPTLAQLFVSGHPSAEEQFNALCATFALRLEPDHEGALLTGAFVERRPVPSSQYVELARSWEQFDRAFAPAEPREHSYALGQLACFVERSCIAGDLGDHVLFIVERDTAPDILVSLGDDAWDDWLATLQRTRADGSVAALRLREHLQRDPRLRAQAPEPDLSGQ